MNPDEAFQSGLVDQLADNPEAAIQQAVEWCTSLLKLPRKAMLETRRVARADLAGLFDAFGQDDVQQFVDSWFDPITQATLKQLAARLGK